MHSFTVYVLAFVAFATYASADFVSYCDCMKDVEKYKKEYENNYKEYYDKSNPTLHKAHEQINMRLAKLHMKNTCNLSTNPDDYIDNLMVLCGGKRLSEEYKPFWESDSKNEDSKEKQKICKFLTVKLPSLCAQTKTMSHIIEKCDYMEMFDKSIKTIIDGCDMC